MAFKARRTRGTIGGAGSADSDETATDAPTVAAAATDDHDDASGDGSGDGSANAAAEAQAPGAGSETATELTFSDHTADDGDDAPRTVGRRGGKRLGGGKRKRKSADGDTAAPAKRSHHAAKPKPPKVDVGAVDGLLSIAEGFLVPQLGPAARFAPQERALIVPSLAGIIDRMTPDVAERFRNVADPLLLAVGLGMWGLRVYGSATRPQRPAQRPGIDRPESGSVTVTPAATGGAAVAARPEPSPPPPVVPPAGRNGAASMPGTVDDALHAAWGTAPL